eukprot:393511-Rhodomonas_salina.3
MQGKEGTGLRAGENVSEGRRDHQSSFIVLIVTVFIIMSATIVVVSIIIIIDHHHHHPHHQHLPLRQRVRGLELTWTHDRPVDSIPRQSIHHSIRLEACAPDDLRQHHTSGTAKRAAEGEGGTEK